MTSLEICSKPVIAAVHSGCIGAGIDMITAADIRYCTEDAWFTVKEVEIGMAADVGTLQRLPKVIGNQSLVRELCFTGRKFTSKEAFDFGLVSKVYFKFFFSIYKNVCCIMCLYNRFLNLKKKC